MHAYACIYAHACMDSSIPYMDSYHPPWTPHPYYTLHMLQTIRPVDRYKTRASAPLSMLSQHEHA